VCIDIYRDYGWTLPPALINAVGNHGSAEELSLIRAIEYTMSDPEVHSVKDPSRYEQSFAHVLAYWGPEFSISELKARQLKEYMFKRKKQGAAGSTVNKERQALSKMFKVLKQADLVDRNPVEDTAPADEKEGQRDVYISCKDFIKIVDRRLERAQPIFETLYLTGMRRGEALGLTWDKVNLETRIIAVGLGDTKERRGKRIPIHNILVQILQAVKQIRSSSTNDRVFLNPDGSISHEDSLTRCWRTVVKAIGFDPKPTVHDLRRCWFTNAVRSKVYPYIADDEIRQGGDSDQGKKEFLVRNRFNSV
jgi:integrase